MKENESNDSYIDNINSNLIIYESEKHKKSLNFMEQRDINDIFDSLELDKDDINLKEISTEKINKEYSNNLII